MSIYSISGLNNLSYQQRVNYVRLMVPPTLFERFNIHPESLTDASGNELLKWVGEPGSSSVEISLFHEAGATDPLMYFHLTDTISKQIHVLLAVINDPHSPRFDIDRMPDGSKTHFGVFKRNVEAELGALNAGLAPGQIRRGLRALRDAMLAFETFLKELEHDI